MAQFDAEITAQLTNIARKTGPSIRLEGQYIVITFNGQEARILASTNKVTSSKTFSSR